MNPLFDVEALAGSADQIEATAKRTAASRPATKVPKAVDYWIRGVFRFGGGTESTHTVRAVGMSNHLDADVARFVRHLTDEGWLFTAGRATLVEVLGVGSDDGIEITLSRGQG